MMLEDEGYRLMGAAFEVYVVFQRKWHRGVGRGLIFRGVITSPGRMSDERDEWIGRGPTRPAEV